MSRKILFFNPYCYWPFHLENELDLIKKHINLNESVHILICNGELDPCDQTLEQGRNICTSCIYRRESAHKLLKKKKKINLKNIINLSSKDKHLISQILEATKPQTLFSLKSVNYESFDIGMAVASSLISHLREPYPHLAHHQDLVNQLLYSSLGVYFSFKNHLREIRPDMVYIFNGRFAILRAAVRACQNLDIKFQIHERAGVQNRYTLTENTLPHDLNYIKREIDKVWSQSKFEHEEKNAQGSQWFEDRRAGKDQGWVSFTSTQNQQIKIDQQKINIVIFNSSEDEFEAIEGWKNPVYKNQNHGILKIASDLKDDNNINLYLRVHPNLTNVSNSQTLTLVKLRGKYKNFFLIEPNDKTSSYFLMDMADLVIVFGSTIGVESAYHKKPVILLGRSPYEDLGVCIVPKSHQELIQLIKSETKNSILNLLTSRETRSKAVRYGFYMSQTGIPFEFFKQEGVYSLTYNGKAIGYSQSPSILQRLLNKLKRIFS